MSKLNTGKLWSTFNALPSLGKLIVIGAIILVFVLAGWGGGMIGHSIGRARADRERAANLKKAQDALALAEAANRRAEAKEAQAALLEKQLAAKEKLTEEKQRQLETEQELTDEKIKTDYANDKARIDSMSDECERCKDTCARLERLSVSNPALGHCEPNACVDACGQ